MSKLTVLYTTVTKGDTMASKDQAILATLKKYPTMSKAQATFYVEEVLGYFSFSNQSHD